MTKKLFLKAIKFYQVFISPNLGDRCRFYPSCSEYTEKSIERYGAFRGGLKGLGRILRCHPWNDGGVDYP